jgi:hypothetical protein
VSCRVVVVCSASLVFCLTFALGCFLQLIASYLYVEPQTAVVCGMQVATINGGFALTFGALFAKIYVRTARSPFALCRRVPLRPLPDAASSRLSTSSPSPLPPSPLYST